MTENKPASTNAAAPATAKQGTVENAKTSDAPSNPANPNQSTKPVGGIAPSTTTQTAGPGNEPPKNPVGDNVGQGQNSIDPTTAPVDDPVAELSADEEKHLERILDGEDDDAPASLSDRTPEDFKDVSTKLKRLILAVPETSPDSHTVWGAGGVVLTLGDLRTLVKYMN